MITEALRHIREGALTYDDDVVCNNIDINKNKVNNKKKFILTHSDWKNSDQYLTANYKCNIIVFCVWKLLKEMWNYDLILINNAYYMNHSGFSGSHSVLGFSSSRCAAAFSVEQDQVQD